MDSYLPLLDMIFTTKANHCRCQAIFFRLRSNLERVVNFHFNVQLDDLIGGSWHIQPPGTS
jgi:hypothetical protein